MSINHYYSNSDLPEAHQWWSQYMINMNHHSSANNNIRPNSNFTSQNDAASSRAAMFNLNNNEDDEDQVIDEQENSSNVVTVSKELEENEEIPKMPMFEKPLTPSDVGKLNRLVIPKQHAEKYFPLNGDSGEKGLLLSFEDEIGKSWRFRYSYWNSSQSYVLTKGWSRFVKEKRLDAGDIVLFLRHRVDAGRLFIGWRRRNSEQESGVAPPPAAQSSSGWNRMFYSNYAYPSQHQAPSSMAYQANCSNAGTVIQNQTSSSGNPKRLRLFGVNLECHVDESTEPSTSDGSPMSSQGQTPNHPYHHQQYYSNNHMDICFSGDVYRQG